jgi:predicted nuclease with TOPRIM domain
MLEPDNIVLEHLRHIRGVVDGTRDDVRELKHRVGSVERETAHVHVELAQVHVKVAELSGRVDRLSDRLERVKRLELADA